MVKNITLFIVAFQLVACVSNQDEKDNLLNPDQRMSEQITQDSSLSITDNDSQVNQADMFVDMQVNADLSTVSDYDLEAIIDTSVIEELEDQSASMLDQASPTSYSSTLSATKRYNYEYSREAVGTNPLKGFTTNYAWGEPANDFGHSLEFKYIPLSDIIDELGNYTFETSLEPSLNEAVVRGHHLIVRAYLDYPALDSGVPLSIRSQLSCQDYDDYGGGCSPDYSDPDLQALVLNFIETFGDRYDGDPRIGFIQVGLLGFWGEWHTYPHLDWFADNAFQQAVITAFDEAFSLTPIQLRIPAQDSPSREIGFHDDSFAYSTVGEPTWFFWPRLQASMADQRWQLAPMGGEIYPPLQRTLFTNSYELGPYSQDPFTTIQSTHMTYLVNYQTFNLDGVGYTGIQRIEAERAAKMMGYEYTVEDVELEVSNLAEEQVDLVVKARLRNSGIAPFYYPLTLKLSSIASGQSWNFDYDLKSLNPAANLSDLVLSLQAIAVSELRDGFTLSLTSPHLLTEQVIHWANTLQENGKLSIPNGFKCSFNSSAYDLFDSVVSSFGQCYCDVDGLFYTVDGTHCIE